MFYIYQVILLPVCIRILRTNVLKTMYVLPIIRLESAIPSLKCTIKVCAIASNLSSGLQKNFEDQFFTHNVLRIVCLERAAGCG